MRVLIACEYSGAVRDAFIAAGHDAMSCDLLPTDQPGPHYQGDVRDLINGWRPVNPRTFYCHRPAEDGMEYLEKNGDLFARPKKRPRWDMMIAHPPCTYLSVSGMHWTARGLRDPKLTEDALDFVRLLLDAPIERIALENPISVISSRIRKPDQIINPWQFGHDAGKRTCLWLKNLPPLVPTEIIEPRIVNGKKRWGNQTDSGQNRLPPSEDRWKIRSATYAGIAQAMADQWGAL